MWQTLHRWSAQLQVGADTNFYYHLDDLDASRDTIGNKTADFFDMNRSHLAAQLAAKFSHLTQQDAEDAVTVILEAMGISLATKQRIEIRGFGSFSIIHRRPRIGRNPRTGESVSIPERLVAHFKPGKSLRQGVDI